MNPLELLTTISNNYQKILGKNLCGIYVHGSLAFDCFHWEKSDIDFLVVVYENLTLNQKISLIHTLLDLNPDAPPKGFEMSVVLYDDCKTFRYPTPFQLHYSNAHIEKITTDIREFCRTMRGTDCDLAAHFIVIKKKGLVLYGLPIKDVFEDVSASDYLASIKADIEDAENDIETNPVYIILNLCRVLAYIKDNLVLSKSEGGKWGICHLSDEYKDLIQEALDCYATDKEFVFHLFTAKKFASFMKQMIFAQ